MPQWFPCSACLVLSIILCGVTTRNVAAEIELRDGERIVLLGGTFIERMQQNGYLETLLTVSHPDRHLVFRNLGWSGDTVWGESRAVFGTAADGMTRLIKDVKETRPTLLIIGYGANEAYAGPGGLSRFAAGYQSLLDALTDSSTRVILLGPHAQEAGHRGLPDPTRYNAWLKEYSAVIAQIAEKRQVPFVELNDLIAAPGHVAETSAENAPRLTDNGLHLNELGYWIAARMIAKQLGCDLTAWQGQVDGAAGTMRVQGGSVLSVETSAEVFRFSVQPDRLLPMFGPANATSQAPGITLELSHFQPGKYELRLDGKAIRQFTAADSPQQLELGAAVNGEQAAELVEAIRVKNELYFHRYRPQNETYLFLFRKHEQGNNAVEIPQFDPLIAEQETRIAALRKPRAQLWEIVRVADTAP